MIRIAGVVLLAHALSGCATPSDPVDPYEPFNRGVYQFNEGIDKAILRPVARAYKAVLPEFVRASVSNVFSNVGDIRNVLNNTLQGKFTAAYSDFGRVAINSTLGVLGLFDIASEAGIEKHDEDFGQTLAWWGIKDGPFLMLPLVGPSTGRDLAGRIVDYATDPAAYIDPSRASNQVFGTRVVNQNAELLDANALLHDAALDPYLFLRDGYLQRRRNLIADGVSSPTAEKMYEELRADRNE